MTKEELIDEIKNQLYALGTIEEVNEGLKLNEIIAMFDLQFRLKCKLYEITNEEGENNGD